MLALGDLVVFVKDGAKGIILELKDQHAHVIWEDQFVSWERIDQLYKEDLGPNNEKVRMIF